MKKILGMPIALFVIAILVVGSGTALLVKYLSNSVTHSVTVSSPLEVVGDSNLVLSVFGGESIVYTTTTNNLANRSIDAYPITEIHGPDVFAGGEIIEVLLEDAGGVYNLTSHTYVIDDNGALVPLANVGPLGKATIKLYFDNTATGVLHKYTYAIGYTAWWTVTFKTNEAISPGVYNIKTCQLYDILGDCE